MRRQLLITVDCDDKTCRPCESLNDQTSPPECLMFQVAMGESMECVPLEWSNRNGGDWLRCKRCLAAERRAKVRAR